MIADSRYLLPIMTAIGDAFQRGRAIDASDLARQMRLPASMVADFCRRLEAAGMIHRVGDDDYTLALPAERIAINDLLKLARSMAQLDESKGEQVPGWALLAELNAAETQATTGRTLADTLKPRE